MTYAACLLLYETTSRKGLAMSGSWTNAGSPTDGTSATISNLTPNTEYDVEVTATNSAGSASASTTATTLAGDAPSAPLNLSASSVTATSLIISWAASASGSATITYQLQYRVVGNTAWTPVGSAGTALTQSVSGLSPSTSYEFEVVAANAYGSATSAPFTASTLSAGTPPSAPTNLTVSSIAQTSATLTWSPSASGTAPIAYQLQYQLSGSTAWSAAGPAGSALSATVSGLQSGSTYNFRVVASNAAGSATSATQSIATLTAGVAPSAPGAPVAWIIMPESVSLSWAASSTGTQPINYQVQVRVTGTNAWTPSGSPSQATSTTVEGLTSGTDYDYQVVATNSAGSSYSNITTILAPVTGGTVTTANFSAGEVLKAADLDAALNGKLDNTGGPVGPLQISQTATGGSNPAMLALNRTAGGAGDSPLISGQYTAVMADGPVVAYSAVGMTLTVTGANGVGPAGNMWALYGSIGVNALRSTAATSTGSKHAAVTGQVTKSVPSGGVPSGRRMADGTGFYAPVSDSTCLPSSQAGGLMGVHAALSFNGLDDADLRYGTRIYYGELTPVSSGGKPAEITRALSVMPSTTTAYAKVLCELGGFFGVSAVDLRRANAQQSVVTSATPASAVTSLSVDKALQFTGAGSPVAAVSSANPKAVTINGNAYSVIGVSLTGGSQAGVLTFASPVSATDAAQGNVVIPLARTIWLSEGGSGVLPGDIAFNLAGTSRIYFDASGGGLTLATGAASVTMSGTGATKVPTGTTAQRPASPILGMIRANSDTGAPEWWSPSTSAWVSFSASTATTGPSTGPGSTNVAPGPALALVAGTPTTTAVPLSWSAPTTGSGTMSYQVQYQVAGVSGWTNWGGAQTGLSTTVSGLSPGTRYNFQIITSNGYGTSTSASTAATTAAAVPVAPTGLTASAVTDTAIALTWTASASGTQPINYQVQYQKNGASTWTTAPAVSTTSEVITGLTAATSYTIRVVAANVGGSATSSTISASTSAAASAAPSAPTALAAGSVTSSSALISWTAPATGTPCTYQVSYRVTGAASFTPLGGPITGTSVTLPGLVASTSYDVEVTAANGDGSATSSAITFSTAAAPVAAVGTIAGSQVSGTANPVIGAPASGTVAPSNVLTVSGVTLTDTSAATASGSCSLKVTCTAGTLTTTISGASVTGSGSNSITFANTLTACEAAAANLTYTAASTTGTDSISITFTDPSGLSSTVSIPIDIATSVPTQPPPGTIPTDQTGTQAGLAQKLLNGFGVNTHIDEAAYQTMTLATVENCINRLGGIKLLRDAMANDSDSTWWTQVAQATNTAFICYIGQTDQTNFQTEFDRIGAMAATYIAAFEGCDEADTGQAEGYNETLAEAATFQQTVYSQGGQAYKVPTIQMSFGQGWSTNPNTGNYGTVGNLAAYADYGNIHFFTNNNPQLNWVFNNYVNNMASLPTPGKPVAVTEFGWIQQTGSSYNSCSEQTAAVYLLETIFVAWLYGCPYYIWRSLIDDVSGTPIGLFDSSGNARPSATAVANLFALLTDSGSNALTFTPGKLNYTLGSFPAQAGNACGGYQALFQKSDGSFWLVLWNEQTLNDSNGNDIAVAPVTITLTLGTQAVSATVYDPVTSTTPVQSESNVTTMSISLPARPILVKIIHQ